MSKISRRDFLRTAALSAGALSLNAILEACGQISQSPVPTTRTPYPFSEQPSATSLAPTDTLPVAPDTPPTATEPLPTSTSTPVTLPDLVVTHGGEPEELIRQAISALGGIQKFVSPGANVIVKPNICVDHRTYEYAATTNPWVVGTLVKLCFEAGAASVKVMDKPFYGAQKKAYEMSGIKEQVEAAGGEMAYMLEYMYIETNIPNAVDLKKTAIYSDILEADVLINVPIAKQHTSSARLTLGMKNLMGVVWDRGVFHNDLGQYIADLNAMVRPQLTVIDAVRILTAYGPTGGSLSYVKQLDTIIAGPDIVAADSYAASLFDLKPGDLPYILAGTRMGLGRSDLENLKIERISLGA